jgi:hypothetical protein
MQSKCFAPSEEGEDLETKCKKEQTVAATALRFKRSRGCGFAEEKLMARLLGLTLSLITVVTPVRAESHLFKLPIPNPIALLSPANPDAFAGALRGYLVHNLPATLYEASPGWGHTATAPNGLHWTGRALPVHPHVQYAAKNDGDWRKVRVAGNNIADTLVLDIRNLEQPELGHISFDVILSMDCLVDYEHQKWESGIRLYSAGAKARLRVKALLSCEATTRLEQEKTLLPNAVFRLRVVNAKVSYDNLVVEHVAGVGGEAAKLIGDGLKGWLHQWKPSIEKELLEKADAAITKSGDTKEVRVSLTQLFGGKKRPATTSDHT